MHFLARAPLFCLLYGSRLVCVCSPDFKPTNFLISILYVRTYRISTEERKKTFLFTRIIIEQFQTFCSKLHEIIYYRYPFHSNAKKSLMMSWYDSISKSFEVSEVDIPDTRYQIILILHNYSCMLPPIQVFNVDHSMKCIPL